MPCRLPSDESLDIIGVVANCSVGSVDVAGARTEEPPGQSQDSTRSSNKIPRPKLVFTFSIVLAPLSATTLPIDFAFSRRLFMVDTVLVFGVGEIHVGEEHTNREKKNKQCEFWTTYVRVRTYILVQVRIQV